MNASCRRYFWSHVPVCSDGESIALTIAQVIGGWDQGVDRWQREP